MSVREDYWDDSVLENAARPHIQKHHKFFLWPVKSSVNGERIWLQRGWHITSELSPYIERTDYYYTDIEFTMLCLKHSNNIYKVLS